MKKNFILNILSFCLLFIVYCLLSTVSYAQQFALSVDPAHVEILSKPSLSLIKVFNFVNSGDPGTFVLKVVSFEPAGDLGERVIKTKAEGPVRFSLENPNYKLNEPFNLGSAERLQAILKIDFLEQAPGGDYYYLLLLSREAPVGQQTLSKSRGAVAANLLFTVSNNGLTEKKGKLALFEIISRYKLRLFGKTLRIVDTADEVPVILKVANIGQNLFAPNAALTLRGNYLKDTTINLLPLNILKNSQRLLYETDSHCQSCSQMVSTTFKGFFLGKYTLTATLQIPGAGEKVYATLDFWGMPLFLLKILLIAFILMILCLIYLYRSLPKKSHSHHKTIC